MRATPGVPTALLIRVDQRSADQIQCIGVVVSPSVGRKNVLDGRQQGADSRRPLAVHRRTHPVQGDGSGVGKPSIPSCGRRDRYQASRGDVFDAAGRLVQGKRQKAGGVAMDALPSRYWALTPVSGLLRRASPTETPGVWPVSQNYDGSWTSG